MQKSSPTFVEIGTNAWSSTALRTVQGAMTAAATSNGTAAATQRPRPPTPNENHATIGTSNNEIGRTSAATDNIAAASALRDSVTCGAGTSNSTASAPIARSR